MFKNTIGFTGITNSVYLPYYYLASDQISGSSYDFDRNTNYIKNTFGDNPQTIFKFSADVDVDCIFLNTDINRILPKIYEVDATYRVGQYAQLYIYGNYVTKTIRIRKEKRKANGNYEILSKEDCKIYVFVIKGYMVNWTINYGEM